MTTAAKRKIAILGTRGIPAQHGGFETFVERLAPYLAERNWQVRVYCQEYGRGSLETESFRGVDLIKIPIPIEGPWGTIFFDWISMKHACSQEFPLLTLGYNTALFSLLARWRGCRNTMNMDGIEWRRGKWSPPVRLWFYLNEYLGCKLADRLVADHPEINKHLRRWARPEKIFMIPYGSDAVHSADPSALQDWGLQSGEYSLVIARPEPENSLLEMVEAFSRRPRRHQLVILGNYRPEKNRYHRKVLRAAGDEVRFPGAIYDPEVVRALRFHARLYLHGHQVGGTNPSLVEALGCGNAILAHDNRFNRWVSGAGADYFSGVTDCAKKLDSLLDDDNRLAAMRLASRARHESFTWDRILQDYEQVCCFDNFP